MKAPKIGSWRTWAAVAAACLAAGGFAPQLAAQTIIRNQFVTQPETGSRAYAQARVADDPQTVTALYLSDQLPPDELAQPTQPPEPTVTSLRSVSPSLALLADIPSWDGTLDVPTMLVSTCPECLTVKASDQTAVWNGCPVCDQAGCGAWAALSDASPAATRLTVTDLESGSTECCLPAQCRDCCQRFWVSADYLLWWVEGQRVPPLVTSSPANTPSDQVGILGLPSTSVLLGGDIAQAVGHGGRLQWGTVLDANRCFALSGSFWGLAGDAEDFTRSSTGNPALARPFFNVDPLVAAPDAELVAYSNLLDGTVAVAARSELYSSNIVLRKNMVRGGDKCRGDRYQLSAFGGYRFLRFNEGLSIEENLVVTATGGLVAQGTTFALRDRFQTKNEFHGSEFGLAWDRQRNDWNLAVLGSVAFGNMSRRVVIDGSTATTVPSLAPTTRAGGLLAQTTNMGTHEENDLVAIPQLQATLGYQLSDCLHASIGYSVIWIGEVARPGDQIDANVNGRLLDPSLPAAGPQQPAWQSATTDMWITGLSLGVNCVF